MIFDYNIRTVTVRLPCNEKTLMDHTFDFFQALGGAQSEPDGSLQRMIDALLSLFNFYHEGLEKTEKVMTLQF